MLDSLFHRFENIIIVDIETTGFDPKRDEIIELAALRIQNHLGMPKFTSELDLFVKLSEGRKLPQKITELTGISEAKLEREGGAKSSSCDQFTEILDCSNPLLVAYNAQFDLSFMQYFMNNYGKADVLNKMKYLDALTVYKDRRPYPHTPNMESQDLKLLLSIIGRSCLTRRKNYTINDTCWYRFGICCRHMIK